MKDSPWLLEVTETMESVGRAQRALEMPKGMSQCQAKGGEGGGCDQVKGWGVTNVDSEGCDNVKMEER